MKFSTTEQIERFRGLEPFWQWIVGATIFLLAFLVGTAAGAHGNRLGGNGRPHGERSGPDQPIHLARPEVATPR